jgi:hypothetical protein
MHGSTTRAGGEQVERESARRSRDTAGPWPAPLATGQGFASLLAVPHPVPLTAQAPRFHTSAKLDYRHTAQWHIFLTVLIIVLINSSIEARCGAMSVPTVHTTKVVSKLATKVVPMGARRQPNRST